MNNGNRVSRFFSQSIVVGLLGLFIVIGLVAMFTNAGVPGEMDWIGMTVEPLGGETANAIGIPSNVGGLLVGDVEGIAARSGVRPGDVLLAVNNNRVKDIVDFASVTSEIDLTKGGVQLDVVRGGIRKPIFVYANPTPAAAGAQNANVAGAAPVAPGDPVAVAPAPTPTMLDKRWLGIDAERFNAGAGRALGVPTGTTGVLVDGVALGSNAEMLGLQTNDLIVSVNGQSVKSPLDLWSVMGGLSVVDPIEIGVFRNGQLNYVGLPGAKATPAGGFAWQIAGQGLGMRGRGMGMGMGGCLVCPNPNCRAQFTTPPGVPCNNITCPVCGIAMVRQQ